MEIFNSQTFLQVYSTNQFRESNYYSIDSARIDPVFGKWKILARFPWSHRGTCFHCIIQHCPAFVWRNVFWVRFGPPRNYDFYIKLVGVPIRLYLLIWSFKNLLLGKIFGGCLLTLKKISQYSFFFNDQTIQIWTL